MNWKKLLLALFVAVELFSADTEQVCDKPETKNAECSSERIGRGGPPKKPPKMGNKVQVYAGNEVIKFDSDGRAYIGVPADEVQEESN